MYERILQLVKTRVNEVEAASSLAERLQALFEERMEVEKDLSYREGYNDANDDRDTELDRDLELIEDSDEDDDWYLDDEWEDAEWEESDDLP